jgi:hypothetical protein
MLISVPVLVALYYSYLFICLSSFPARFLEIRDFTFHLYVINVKNVQHMIDAVLVFMELIRNNRLGSYIVQNSI